MRPSACETAVTEIMIRHVVAVRAHLPLEELEGLFLRFGISGAPVVDGTGRLVGMVSKTDLIWEHHARPVADAADDPAAWGRAAGGELELESTPRRRIVDDIMSATVLSLPQTASIAHAAALMAHEGVHRLPIISATGLIVGQVSSLDVLRWLGHAEGFVLPPSDE